MSTAQIQHLKLAKITTNDYNDIKRLTAMPSVMKYIGSGKTWTAKQVQDYIAFCQADELLPADKRQYFGFKLVISSNGLSKFGGIIEFNRIGVFQFFPENIKLTYPTAVVLRIFIDPAFQNRGLGKRAIGLLMGRIRQIVPEASHLLSMVYADNKRMSGVMTRLGFEQLDRFKYHGKMFVLYGISVKK
jgi:RimJ/RimL family protein N-acetyltransferase